MAKLRIIFDVHQKVEGYRKLIEEAGVERSLQLGDFGFASEHNWHMENVDGEKHKVLLGNHDDTRFVFAPHSIGHFGEFCGVFCVRGAFTPDAWRRQLGVDLFLDEQLDYGQQTEAFEAYEKAKPRIVVTHDCPQFVRESIVHYNDMSSTPKFLQHLYDIHQPEMWIFGHNHREIDEVAINERTGVRTRFVCGKELDHIDIDV